MNVRLREPVRPRFRWRNSATINSTPPPQFFDVLRNTAVAVVVAAAVLWLFEWPERQAHRRYQRFTVVHTANGQPGSPGRRAALEDLIRDGELLHGLQLTKADLAFAQLNGARLDRAGLANARLEGAHMASAHFADADFTGADLRHTLLTDAFFPRARLVNCDLSVSHARGASFDDAVFDGSEMFHFDATSGSLARAFLRNAGLREAKFTDAYLCGAHLVDSDLRYASFVNADLVGADLLGSELYLADFEGADLTAVDLRGARLEGLVHWRSIQSLEDANIYGVILPPDGFWEWATEEMGAVAIRDDAAWYRHRLGNALYRDRGLAPPPVEADPEEALIPDVEVLVH